jgi:hypothetical protein
MQARILWTGRKLWTGQVDAGKNTVDRQEVMNRAGGCRQEYCGRTGNYEQDKLLHVRALWTSRKL